MLPKIHAPFTPAQVEALNHHQLHGQFHQFTCSHCRDADTGTTLPKDEHVLVATPDGWTCPTCSYTQNWAYEFMAEGSNAKSTLGNPVAE